MEFWSNMEFWSFIKFWSIFEFRSNMKFWSNGILIKKGTLIHYRTLIPKTFMIHYGKLIQWNFDPICTVDPLWNFHAKIILIQFGLKIEFWSKIYFLLWKWAQHPIPNLLGHPVLTLVHLIMQKICKQNKKNILVSWHKHTL